MKLKICSLAFTNYLTDARVRREAETLQREGAEVDVICLKRIGENDSELYNGVRLIRIPVVKKRQGKLNYVWEYSRFIVLAFLRVSILFFKRRYDVIHVHNMPDILVICAIVPRIFGAKIILDLHDPVPEVYMAKYNLSADHVIIKLLKIIEYYSAKFAHKVLTPNIAFKELFVSRKIPEDKIKIVMNTPDEKLYKTTKGNLTLGKRNGNYICMFHGLITERHGIETALRAINSIRNEIPEIQFHIYGEGDGLDRMLEVINELDLHETVKYYGHVTFEEIVIAIENADIGLIPNYKSPLTELNFPVRIFEYLSLKKPVIVPDTKGINDYFNKDSILYFNPGDYKNLADVLINALKDQNSTQIVLKKGIDIYNENKWSKNSIQFLDVFHNIIN